MNTTEKTESPDDPLYRDLFENAPAAYGIVNPEGTITEVNDRFANMTGYAPEILTGTGLNDVFSDVTRNSEGILNLLDRMSCGEYIEDRKLKLNRPGEETQWFRGNFRRVCDEQGDPLKYWLVLFDEEQEPEQSSEIEDETAEIFDDEMIPAIQEEDLLEDPGDLKDTIFAECEVIEKIGEGGMAHVYRGRHTKLDLDVVLKVINSSCNSDRSCFQRFLEEARIAFNLDHPNIVDVFNAGEEKAMHYIMMRYIEGASVKELIQKYKQLPESTVLKIVKQVAKGLRYAHSNNIIHRDVKPDNMLMEEGRTVLISDFGVAQLMDDVQKQNRTENMLVGTPHFMAPEQWRNELLDHRVDLYGLGVSMFTMLTGRYPFSGNSLPEFKKQHLRTSPPDPWKYRTGISDETISLMNKLMARDRDERFSDFDKFLQSLKHLMNPS